MPFHIFAKQTNSPSHGYTKRDHIKISASDLLDQNQMLVRVSCRLSACSLWLTGSEPNACVSIMSSFSLFFMTYWIRTKCLCEYHVVFQLVLYDLLDQNQMPVWVSCRLSACSLWLTGSEPNACASIMSSFSLFFMTYWIRTKCLCEYHVVFQLVLYDLLDQNQMPVRVSCRLSACSLCMTYWIRTKCLCEYHVVFQLVLYVYSSLYHALKMEKFKK